MLCSIPTRLLVMLPALLLSLGVAGCKDALNVVTGEKRYEVLFQAACELKCNITYRDEKNDKQTTIAEHVGSWSLTQKVWGGSHVYLTVTRKEGRGALAAGIAYGTEGWSESIPSGYGAPGDFVTVSRTLPSANR